MNYPSSRVPDFEMRRRTAKEEYFKKGGLLPQRVSSSHRSRQLLVQSERQNSQEVSQHAGTSGRLAGEDAGGYSKTIDYEGSQEHLDPRSRTTGQFMRMRNSSQRGRSSQQRSAQKFGAVSNIQVQRKSAKLGKHGGQFRGFGLHQQQHHIMSNTIANPLGLGSQRNSSERQFGGYPGGGSGISKDGRFRVAIPGASTKKTGMSVSKQHWAQASQKIALQQQQQQKPLFVIPLQSQNSKLQQSSLLEASKQGSTNQISAHANARAGGSSHFRQRNLPTFPANNRSEVGTLMTPESQATFEGQHQITTDLDNMQGSQRRSTNQTRDPLMRMKDGQRPYHFLSTLGGKDTFAMVDQISPHNDLVGQTNQVAEESEPIHQIKKRRDIMIFTNLDVGKPLPVKKREMQTQLASGYIMEKISTSKSGTHRQESSRGSHSQIKQMLAQHRASSGLLRSSIGVSSSRVSPAKVGGGDRRSDGRLNTGISIGIGDAEVLLTEQGRTTTKPDGMRSSGMKIEDISLSEGDNETTHVIVPTFGEQLMATQPTTALLKEKDDKLPYPELFDRSERTFAATYAKFGDLSYFTPIQRIGLYMDYSQRLKKRHLTDLIAYLKTAKHPIKPLDDDHAKTEEGEREYLEHCIFVGAMPQEDAPKQVKSIEDSRAIKREQKEAMLRVYDFPPPPIEDRGTFNYNSVWSEQLLKQVELSTHRFTKYLDSADSIRNEEVAKFKKEWMQKALDLLPEMLLQKYSEQVKKVFQEVFSSYVRAIKQAILEYILRSPDERKRLHILMLPQPRITSADRHLMQGGYSISKFPGHHQRRLEAESQIKLKLSTYNIVSSSLQNWWQEFSHFDLIQLRSLGQFIQEKEPGKPGQALYSMEMSQFFMLQATYKKKVTSLLKNIWHRGCLTIIRKFKMLRNFDQHRQYQESGSRLGGRSKWTFAGFKPGKPENSKRKWVKDSTWRDLYLFDCLHGDMTPLQAYYFRTATVHQNVHLHYFLNEAGMECTDTLQHADLLENTFLESLVDIRDNVAYRAFVQLIGGVVDLNENGFEALDSDFQHDIILQASILMQNQLRQIIERSVRTLRNFFRGFLTLDQLKDATGGSPLRVIRPLITQSQGSDGAKRSERKNHEERIMEEIRQKNPMLAAQLATRQENEVRRKQDTGSTLSQYQSLSPELSIPSFFDFQDFVSPVFRLELTLRKVDDYVAGSEVLSSHLEFSLSDEEVLAGFQKMVEHMVTAFDGFLKPEFCTVLEMSPRHFEAEWEAIPRLLKEEKAQGLKAMGPGDLGFQPPPGNLCPGVIQDFEELLFPESDIGHEIYRKYMGRIAVEEVNPINSRVTATSQKKGSKKNVVRQSANSTFKVGNPQEPCFQQATRDILSIVSTHLRETKKVLEVFEQFKPIICGSLSERVREFLREGEDQSVEQNSRSDSDYSAFITELRYFQKLSRQLPTIVMLPMFEVGVIKVKNEIQRRIQSMLDSIFEHYESTVISTSQAICQKFEDISAHLGKTLTCPKDSLEMEKYKSNLLLDMGKLQIEIKNNKDSFFFLMKLDWTLKQETQDLILKLLVWPKKLDAVMAEAEERHEQEKAALEDELNKLRVSFTKEAKAFEENVKEVAGWGEFQSYRIHYDKLQNYNSRISEMARKNDNLLDEEKMLFGCIGEYEAFKEIRRQFTPLYDLGQSVYDIVTKKRSWNDTQLSQVNPQEIEQTIMSLKVKVKYLQDDLDSAPSLRVLQSLRQQVQEISDQLPMFQVLCDSTQALDLNFILDDTTKSHLDVSFGQLKLLDVNQQLPALLSKIREQQVKQNKHIPSHILPEHPNDDHLDTQAVQSRFEKEPSEQDALVTLQGSGSLQAVTLGGAGEASRPATSGAAVGMATRQGETAGETEIRVISNTTETADGEIASEFIGDLFGKVQGQLNEQ